MFDQFGFLMNDNLIVLSVADRRNDGAFGFKIAIELTLTRR